MKTSQLGARLRERRRALGLTQKQLAREMGYDHSRVSRMERAQENLSERYLQQFIRVTGLSDAEADELWALYNQVAADAQSLAPFNPAATELRRGRSLPPYPYYPLRACEQALAQIMAHLEQPRELYAICLYGSGGVGKTTLALEAARRLLERERFVDALWLSARRDHNFDRDTPPRLSAPLEFEQLLDTFALQMGLNEAVMLPAKDKRQTLADHFWSQPYLVILDNLEDSRDPMALTRQMLELMGQSRLLVTTRDRDLGKIDLVWLIAVEGLSKRDAVTFLQTEGTRVGLRLNKAALNELRQAHAATAGNPFALKRVLSQAQQWGVATALDALRQAPAPDTADFYAYLFARDWEILDDAARRLWIYLGRMIPTSVSVEHLAAQGIALSDFDAARQALVVHGLVEQNGSAAGAPARLSLHPLAQQFIQQLAALVRLDDDLLEFHRAGCVRWAAEGWLALVSADRAALMEAPERAAMLFCVRESAQLGWADRVAAMWETISTALAELGYWNDYEQFEYLALEAAQALGNRAMEAKIVSELGWLAIERGEVDLAAQRVHRALGIFTEQRSRHGIVIARRYNATIKMQQHDFAGARRELMILLNVIREYSKTADAELQESLRRQEITARASLGETLMELGEYAEAEREMQYGFDHALVRGPFARAISFYNFGQLWLKQGELTRAQAYFDECLAYARANNLRKVAANALLMLATVAQAEGNRLAARELGAQAQRLYRRIGASAEEKTAAAFLAGL